jgi:eukaryotic-like serine/threonine-protein kinase
MQILQRVLGEKHPQTLDAAANYARFLHRRGELARAEAMLSKVAELDRQARGQRHAFVGHDLVNRGMVRLDMQQHAQAEQDFRAALDIYAEALPTDHPYVVSALSGLGRCMLERNHLAEAEQTLRRAKQIAAKSLPIDSPQLAAANSSLGRVLMAQRRSDEAAKLLRESYPILVQAQGEGAVIVQRTREALAQLDAMP